MSSIPIPGVSFLPDDEVPMNTENLVRMSNQIGAFFESMPNREEALADIATHIKRFWAPQMRHQLLDWMEKDGGVGLDGIVKDALSKYAETLR